MELYKLHLLHLKCVHNIKDLYTNLHIMCDVENGIQIYYYNNKEIMRLIPYHNTYGYVIEYNINVFSTNYLNTN